MISFSVCNFVSMTVNLEIRKLYMELQSRLAVNVSKQINVFLEVR